jgi:DNA modification methylase
MTPYYERDGITLYHGDCREILPTLPKVDLVLTDPPYGIDYVSRWGSTSFAKVRGDREVCTDWIPSLPPCSVVFLFTRWDVLQPWREGLESIGLKVRDALVWDKRAHGAGDPTTSWAPTYELILFASQRPVKFVGGRPQNILRHWRVDAGATGASSGRMLCHPNEKPIPLVVDLISKYDAPVILDPFAGSGTTLVAAKRLGRRAIGIEIEERYCEIAAARLEAERLTLFEAAPQHEQLGLM